jgi:2-furoate---CoA ligase
VTLAALLHRAAWRRPQAEAVVDGTRRVTYRELWEQAHRLADGLARLGLRRGDRTLIAMRNRLEHVLVYWALQLTGGVPVPVNVRLPASDLRYMLDDSEAAAVLFEGGTAPAVLEAAGRHPRLIFAGDRPPAGARALREVADSAAERGLAGAPPAADDLSLILYTSGTTGRPKGVPRTHRAHHAGALAHVIQCRYEWGERALGVMPLHHTMGIHALTSMAAVNGCFVCQPDWGAAGALELIEAERLSALYLVPTLFYDLVHAAGLAPERVATVRKLAYAGASMSTALTAACAVAFRPDVFVNHYGSTEIYTFAVEPDARRKPGSAGRPGIHSRLRVVAASAERRVTPEETVAPGEAGEIIAGLDSDEAFAGYWKRPDADTRAIRDGWYFTGDIGHVDGDGDLHVAGRVDDMIISGGENIHPIEVEEVLARHPRVRDAAVIGEPDERWGERVVAFVVPADPGLTAAALDEHCRQSADLAHFKRPRRIVFVGEIPRTASGKILRRFLRDRRDREDPG